MANNFDDEDKTKVVESETFKGRLEQARNAPPCLVLLVGPPEIQGRLWTLTLSEMVIGRDMESDIYVEDRSVSRTHARLYNVAGEVSVMDLESSNKTVVNGRVLPPMMPLTLKNNDQIKTGNLVFKFLEQGSLEAVSNKMNFDMRLQDALTGITNKGGLLAKSDEAIRRCNLLKTPLSIIVFDLDHFKSVNDTYGHDAGDYVLKELAKVIQSKVIRSNDVFARYGGEEFVIILSDTLSNRAMEVGERVRSTVEGHAFVYNKIKLPITVSVGVATRGPDDTYSWDDLFKKADSASYVSKQQGRNKVNKG